MTKKGANHLRAEEMYFVRTALSAQEKKDIRLVSMFLGVSISELTRSAVIDRIKKVKSSDEFRKFLTGLID